MELLPFLSCVHVGSPLGLPLSFTKGREVREFLPKEDGDIAVLTCLIYPSW